MVTAYPANILANGISTSTITATVSYTGGYIVSGTVSFTTTLGTLSALNATTDADGKASVILTSSTTVGTPTVTATSDSISDTTTVEFVPGSPFTVTVMADPSSITADGVSTSTITATVVDQYTNPVTDTTVVTFTTSMGHICTTCGIDGQVTGTTTSGVATAILTGTVTGMATITATANSISDTTNVTFTAGPPKVVTVTVDSSTISCGVTTTIRVTVTDEYHNVVTDTTPVTLTTDLTVNTFPLTETTKNGLVTATIHGDKAASGTITATTTGNVSGTTALTVTYSTPCTLTLVSSLTTIVANGVDSATITATVIDACGNPVSSTTVLFTTSLGSIGSLTTTKTTDVNGQAAATLTGTKSGVATITATADSASGTTTVTFAALPVPVGGVTYAAEGSLVPWIGVAALAVLVLFGAAFLLSRHRSWPRG